MESTIYFYNEYRSIRTSLISRGIKIVKIDLEHFNLALEKVLKISTEIITSHIEAADEERSIFEDTLM